MSLAMTPLERMEFLAGVHVGVLAVVEPSGAPLAAPLWYGYEPGADVRMVISGASRKAVAMRSSGRACLCVQTEQAPYKYVSVEGPVTLLDGYDPDELLALAVRYLGEELGRAYVSGSDETMGETVTAALTPERWYTVDYTKQFS